MSFEPEWLTRLKRQIAPALDALAQSEELRRTAEQALRQAHLPQQQTLRELERAKTHAVSPEMRELAKRLHRAMRPLVPPQAIRNVQHSIRPVSDDLLRTLQQQTQWQDQIRELSRSLEQLNSLAEAAAAEEGITEPPPAENAEKAPNWYGQLPPAIRLDRLLPLALSVRSQIQDFIEAVQADNLPAAILQAATIVSAVIVAVTDPASPPKR